MEVIKRADGEVDETKPASSLIPMENTPLWHLKFIEHLTCEEKRVGGGGHEGARRRERSVIVIISVPLLGCARTRSRHCELKKKNFDLDLHKVAECRRLEQCQIHLRM
ncbi:hypothetical protein JOB18_035896 [Solea senegalensis]|uniref:Uncharacterized protein n=1 Tax=Solea senegalensis TaxID=28829 RepID=A0AAV6Q810_SOLSE|nr:hypothetical protein JOB18_035896 [Solea senegalensis]